MSTRKQREANRRNARHSTGPRTDAGKQRSSQNALKHGLLAVQSVIPGEDPADYDRLLTEFAERFLPSDPYERSLVRQMADAEWRLRRISRLESAFLHAAAKSSLDNAKRGHLNDPEPDATKLLGRAMQLRTADMARFAAYETHLSRRQRQARDELRKCRKKRDQEIKLANEAARQGRPYGRDYSKPFSETPPPPSDQQWHDDDPRESTRFRPTTTESATSDPPSQTPSDESAA